MQPYGEIVRLKTCAHLTSSRLETGHSYAVMWRCTKAALPTTIHFCFTGICDYAQPLRSGSELARMSDHMTHLGYTVKGQQDILCRHLLQLGGQILRHCEWALLVCVHKKPRKVRNKATTVCLKLVQVWHMADILSGRHMLFTCPYCHVAK